MLACLMAITRGVNFVNADLYFNEASFYELEVVPNTVNLNSMI